MTNLAQHLVRQARDRGDKRALICGEASWSYRQIHEIVCRLAGGLAREGVQRGTHVGLLMAARPEFIFYQQALFMTGATVTPLNVFYVKREVAAAIESCDIEYLIVSKELLANVPIAEDDVAQRLKRVFVLDVPPTDSGGRTRSASGLAAGATPVAGPAIVGDDDVALLLNTSATTGRAKGVMLTIANIRANYDPTPEWLGLDQKTITLLALPLYNTFGLNQGINALMVTGGTLVLVPRFDPLPCLEAISRYRCSFFPAVPTMLQKVFDHPGSATYDLSSITRILTGGAPVPAALLERIHAKTSANIRVMTGYGLTEATAIVTLDVVELGSDGRVKRPKSIGRPLPTVEMRIEDELGRAVPAGSVGEICLRGPFVMKGYYNQPAETEAAISDGWLHTGDLGYITEDGYGYIVDRKKDLIIRGGQNIYPVDVEEVLYSHSGVREAAVVGVPDDMLGEVPIAFVALQPGAQVTPDTLLAHCRRELSAFKVPKIIHILDELPKGPTGKILRRGLHMGADQNTSGGAKPS